MPHYTQSEWMHFVGEHMPDAMPPALDGYRNDNNIFVDGMPPPQYTGPLSSGGSAGVKPQTQGTTRVDPEDQTGAMPQGAPTGPLPFHNVGEWSKGMQGLTGEEVGYGQKRESERAAQYDAARKALEARRFGPSKAEQLFALSAAIGTPMIRPSFGGVMHNVTGTLADIAKSTREAQTSRADALAALQQSYANTTDAAKIAEFRARREAMAPMGRVLAQLEKPAGASIWSENLGRFVPRDHPVAIKSGNIAAGPYKGGTAVQYSDGSHEVRTADGQVLRFGADGQPLMPEGGQ